MYTRLTRSGGRTYLQLVESYRDERGKPRQRVIANLGRLDRLTDKDLEPLIGGLQRALGRVPESGAEIRFESARPFGDLYALHQLWAELGLGEALRRALRSSRRGFDAEALVRAMVFNRLCDPQSKLGVLRWLETVAMPEMPDSLTHDQLLRAMDALMTHIDAVEQRVARLLRPLLDERLSVVFYDLTTVRVHAEGEAGTADLRQFGHSKDTGGISRQFVLGVVQSADGLPLMHTVEPGNVAETATLQPMLERVLERFAVERLVVVADRGLLSLDNVADLEALAARTGRGIEFILAVPARRYGELAEAVIGLDAEAGLAEGRYGGHRLIVDYDAEAAARQRAARRERLAELIDFGEQLAQKLDRQDEGVTERGRRASDRGAFARFHRRVLEAQMSRFLSVDFEADRFRFEEDTAAIERAEALDGKLVLLSNVEDLPAAQIVERYRALADIERGFRVLKSDIEIAPVYHRLPERICAHALICFLALVLHRIIRSRLKAAGSPLSPQRALATLRQIQRHRVAIGGRPVEGTSRPRGEQLQLFRDLGLERPAEGV
ncbi:MAG TPA: IS1634 family transposase [Halomonas sp.]|nr:IS1634 family transposase [Halomonas sp.]